MKEITIYQCEHCGRKYVSKAGALRCEKTHTTDLKVVSYTINEDDEDERGGFPKYVFVEDQNGCVQMYVYATIDELVYDEQQSKEE